MKNGGLQAIFLMILSLVNYGVINSQKDNGIKSGGHLNVRGE